MGERLTKSVWIEHGLATLASEGPDAIKTGRMAKALEVSRGSFYWHFADIAEFRAELLSSWTSSTTDQIIRDLGDHARSDRLTLLFKRAFGHDLGLEMAIRSWAANDRGVAGVVAEVDTRRISYIAGLLIDAGVDGNLAATRATFIYWAYLGQRSWNKGSKGSIAPKDMDDLVAMFEA